MSWLIPAAACYCLADFVLGLLLGRCVLPGLRCRACRQTAHHKES